MILYELSTPEHYWNFTTEADLRSASKEWSQKFDLTAKIVSYTVTKEGVVLDRQEKLLDITNTTCYSTSTKQRGFYENHGKENRIL